MSRFIGNVSAYAYAVSKGYMGTEEEFAELMASYADVGQTAVDAKDAAVAAKTAAQTAATTATNKASEATTAAQTATTKAGEASTSASTATSAKDTAVSASQTATTKATEATTAAATATSAATTATTAKDDAVSAKTAAQTAQTGAETAAASVQSSAAQIATNTSDISQLKNTLTDKADRTDMLKAFPTDTASGSIASFSDGADNIPMKSVKVRIEPVQAGSGDPSPDNVRTISGWDSVQVSHSGADRTNPTTKTIPLPQTVYGGTLDVTNGVLTVDRAMVDLGTLAWALDGSRFKARIDNMANKAGRTIKMACSCFKALANGEPYDASADLVCYGAYSYVYVHDFAYTDTAAFKTAVTGQQLAYELTTPLEIQLDAHTLNSLYGQNNLWADSGDTTAEYRADTKLYIAKKIAEALASLT